MILSPSHEAAENKADDDELVASIHHDLEKVRIRDLSLGETYLLY